MVEASPTWGRCDQKGGLLLLAKRFGSRVRAARIARGWSQGTLAKQIGISSNHIGVIERGEKAPSLDTIAAFAHAFGVTMGELLDTEAAGTVWLKKLAVTAAAVPPPRRQLLITLLAAIVVALTRAEEDESPGMAGARTEMDELLKQSATLAPDDPRILVIVDLLRARTSAELDLALNVIRALR